MKGKAYGSSGSAYRTLLGGKRKINKSVSERAGKAYTTVQRADGTVGHNYGSYTVWLKPKKKLGPVGGAKAPGQ